MAGIGKELFAFCVKDRPFVGAGRWRKLDHNYIFKEETEEAFLIAVEGRISNVYVHINLVFSLSQNIPKTQIGRGVSSDTAQRFSQTRKAGAKL